VPSSPSPGTHSRSVARTRALVTKALGLALTGLVWLAPPAVLPIPSSGGPEGPPRPYGVEPETGGPAPSTNGRLAAAQNHALLFGPFPRAGLTRGVSEGTLLLNEPSDVRELALQRIRETGATVVRIPVNWRTLVVSPSPPGFQPQDPASPAYDFAPLDEAVIDAESIGLEPLLVVSHAPAFAEAMPRWPYAYPGSWAPDPAALEAFAVALASRYDGSFPSLLAPSGVLPRVRLFQAWNEPNLPRYLEPQWVAQDGHWQAFSPLLYRQLLNAFYAGVKAVDLGDVVIAAGVAPNGDPAGVGRMQPVTFLEKLLCLPLGACPERAHFDVLDFHPLSVGNPDVPASSSLDVSIADAAKVTRLLRRAERAGTVLPAGERPVWVTEINWESAPQTPHGVPPNLQAAWVSRALHRLWVAGVQLVAWQFLVDPYPGVSAETPLGGTVEYPRPAGLYAAGAGGQFASATPKPFLRGFTLPFDPLRVNAARVRVWALLMRPGETVALQRRGRRGAWHTIASLHADGAGVLNVLLKLRGAMSLRVRSGALTSAISSVPARRSRL
jgi:hypothetical protein